MNNDDRTMSRAAFGHPIRSIFFSVAFTGTFAFMHTSTDWHWLAILLLASLAGFVISSLDLLLSLVFGALGEAFGAFGESR